MKKLEINEEAPNFTLNDQDEKTISLSDYKGKKVFVYFYPKASTGGCTTQATEIRDALEFLNDKGITVMGISPDLPNKQKKFADNHQLNFMLLSDPEKVTAEAYGVWGEKSMYGKKYMGIIRSAFLVSENGMILNSWYKISPKKTVPELKKAISNA